MRVVGVVVRVEHAVERLAAHAQELLAQIGRGVDQHRRVPLLAEPLDQQRCSGGAGSSDWTGSQAPHMVPMRGTPPEEPQPRIVAR